MSPGPDFVVHGEDLHRIAAGKPRLMPDPIESVLMFAGRAFFDDDGLQERASIELLRRALQDSDGL